MTNEEAIKMLKSKMDGSVDTSYEWVETVRLAIKVLEQQPCEDCTVIKKLSKKYYVEDAYGYTDEDIVNKVNEIIDAVNESSSITPQPKIGRWIRQTDDYHDYYECEQCGIAVGLDDIKNYCPNCGCRMEVEE